MGGKQSSDVACSGVITLCWSLILALLFFLGLGLVSAGSEYQWIIETVGEGLGIPSMIRASDGTLHACFRIDDSVGYAYRDNDGWSDVERVDPDNLGGAYVKIGLNAAGYPVIAYQKADYLWVAVRAAERWTTELVVDRVGSGKLLDLAIDPSGRYHIVYAIQEVWASY